MRLGATRQLGGQPPASARAAGSHPQGELARDAWSGTRSAGLTSAQLWLQTPSRASGSGSRSARRLSAGALVCGRPKQPSWHACCNCTLDRAGQAC